MYRRGAHSHGYEYPGDGGGLKSVEDSSSSGVFTSDDASSSAGASERSYSGFSSGRNFQRNSQKDSAYGRQHSFDSRHSNWRQPGNERPVRASPTSPKLHFAVGVEAVDNLTPHFCSQGKKSDFGSSSVGSSKHGSRFTTAAHGSNFNRGTRYSVGSSASAGGNIHRGNLSHGSISFNFTSSAAVDNLVPKFAQIEMAAHSESFPKSQLKGKENGMRRNERGSWIFGGGLSWSIRRKFEEGPELNEKECKLLSYPQALRDMLASAVSLNIAINELDENTSYVAVDEIDREEEARKHLQLIMLPIYPSCRIFIHGSRFLGIAHSKSSFFMFFDADNNYHGSPTHDKNAQDNVRGTLYERIRDCGDCENVVNWDVQELVTYSHSKTNLRCVVCVDDGMKHHSALLMKMYLKLDKRLRPLTLAVSDLVYRYHDLSKYFTTFILQLMIIMYLQQLPKPVLPTLDQLRKIVPCAKTTIKGFDCSFPSDVSSVPPSSNFQSLAELLHGFCTFYACFNWKEDVVSILGPPMKRSMFTSPTVVPPDIAPPLSTYLESLRVDSRIKCLNTNLPIVVQDPFDLSLNTAEKVNEVVLQVFTMMCHEADELIHQW